MDTTSWDRDPQVNAQLRRLQSHELLQLQTAGSLQSLPFPRQHEQGDAAFKDTSQQVPIPTEYMCTLWWQLVGEMSLCGDAKKGSCSALLGPRSVKWEKPPSRYS